MKVGDLVKLKKPKIFQKTLDGLAGIIIEHVHQPPMTGTGGICRVVWPIGHIDKAWRRCTELEVISESR